MSGPGYAGGSLKALFAVKITDANAQSTRTHEGVERLVQKYSRRLVYLMGEVLSDRSLACVRIISVPKFGQQQQTCVIQGPRGHDDDARGLEDFSAGSVDLV